MTRAHGRGLALVAAAAIAGALGCSGNKGASPPGNPDGGAPPVPFEAVQPFTYVAKVKNLLLGLPPTDDEIRQVTADPGALRSLVGGWMQQPEYQRKMTR